MSHARKHLATWLTQLACYLCSACSVATAEPARGACELMLWTKITPKSNLQYSVQIIAENTSSHALAFVLPDRCPAGPLEFAGLPDGYDYYQICNAGACAGPAGLQSVQLAAREKRVLAKTLVAAQGSDCNTPLETALYRLQPVAPTVSYRVCIQGANLDLRQAKIIPKRAPTAPKAPAPTLAPTPAAPRVAPSAEPTACKSSDECVISCPQVAGCCGWSCGCRNAIRRDQVDAFTANYKKTCTKPPHCMAVGCAYQPAYGAVCQGGRCTATSEIAH